MDDQLIRGIDAYLAEYIEGFMFHDVQVAIDGGANYLAALGLVTYTEFMGGLINGTLGRDGWGKTRDRMWAAWCRMGNAYAELCTASDELNAVDAIRHGLTHTYFFKQLSTIAMRSGGETCGIQMVDGRLWFVVERYFNDFKAMVARYRHDLVEERDPALLAAWRDALRTQWHFMPSGPMSSPPERPITGPSMG